MNTAENATGAARLDTGTRLAMERTRVAYERTMMAWIRTGTSLIAFGFSVYKYFNLELAGRSEGSPLLSAREFGLMLIAIGLLSLLLGTLEHRRDMNAMRADYPGMPTSPSTFVAYAMGALGLLALAAVLYRA